MALLWVNKTASSASLSHSDEKERLDILSQVQRRRRPVNTRLAKLKRTPREKKKELHETCSRTFSNGSTVYHPPRICRSSTPQTLRLEELRIISLFLNHTTFKLINLTRDHDFWMRRVPCMASERGAILHLVTAIVSTHDFITTGGSRSSDRLALEECNKAIGLLRGTPPGSNEISLVSCILLAAFNLLRCEMATTHAIVESGTKLAMSAGLLQHDGIPTDQDTNDIVSLLFDLRFRHGFKLWSSDIAFSFEKLNVLKCPMIIDFEIVWTAKTTGRARIAEIAEHYKDLMMNTLTRIIRNLARGAHIDPDSSLSVRVSEELRLLAFHVQDIYPDLDKEGQITLKQLEIGINYATLLFHSKICTSTERFFDEQDFDLCKRSLQTAQEVIDAVQRFGLSPHYLERIVNGAIFSFGLCSRAESLQQQAVSLFRRQGSGADGMLNWTRACALEAINALQNQIFLERANVVWAIILDVTHDMGSDNLVVQYTRSDDDDTELMFKHRVDWESAPLSEKSAIVSILKGIVSSYRMYRKPPQSEAPRGFLREMIYNGAHLPVILSQASGS